MKMACGDRRLPIEGGLRPRAAILDPELTRTQPAAVAAATAMDAITHAVETAGCRVRTDVSRAFSREAWKRLTSSVERAIHTPDDAAAGAEMLLGAHLAGCAIENAMLGAAHACANPLTARFGIVHGVAVGVMLPHVVRFNAATENPYSDLLPSAHDLAREIERFLAILGITPRLSDHGVSFDALPGLAGQAATQWTAGFNPRPVGERGLLEVYRAAM
jgi:alcohol dehydrogenase